VAPEGTLGWAETKRGPSEREEEFLVRLVRTIRNNLFHGGKFPYPDGPVQDVARDRELINSALVVLKEALALHPDLDATFREAA